MNTIPFYCFPFLLMSFHHEGVCLYTRSSVLVLYLVGTCYRMVEGHNQSFTQTKSSNKTLTEVAKLRDTNVRLYWLQTDDSCMRNGGISRLSYSREDKPHRNTIQHESSVDKFPHVRHNTQHVNIHKVSLTMCFLNDQTKN